jgi:hypothetical protein
MENVWDSNFVLVAHLTEDANTSADGYNDSTSNENHGTGISMNTNITGQLEVESPDFVPSNDYIEVTDSASLDITDAVTISVWARPDADPVTNGYLYSKNTAYSMLLTSSTKELRFFTNNTTDVDIRSGATLLTQDVWNYCVGKYDKDASSPQASLFLNNTSVATGIETNAMPTNSFDARFGQYDNGAGTSAAWAFPGGLQEIRISNIYRTDNWETTNYNNQNSSSTFYTLAALEENPSSFKPQALII